MNENKYTQRAWDRIVGIGKVPDEYKEETKLEEYKKATDGIKLTNFIPHSAKPIM